MKNVFRPADILLPKNTDWEKWSVVACDQYTSEPEYWEKVESLVGDAKSTLRLTLPEIYLESADAPERIAAIGRAMETYAPEMKKLENSFVYVERTLSGGRVRRGIVGMVDLEAYNYEKGAKSPIRATEGTVIERIPPRLKVREGASMELPHVMILIDDRDKTVIEPLAEKKGEVLYDFDLMMGGGHIAGWRVEDTEADRVQEAIAALAVGFTARTGEENPFVFAMGDGNHSLATAKAYYENIKKTLSPEEAAAHPARYALAEIVNLHDEALIFEPIHRVVFGVNPETLLADFEAFCAKNKGNNAPQEIPFYHAGGEGVLKIEQPVSPLAVGTLQRFLDEQNVKIDYIHGADVTERLGKEPGNIGFLLPPMDKNALFDTVEADGVLPRKTFSMGEACEKRFYLEARKITE
ncbi:MAG: DUF1015 domain-containing protein [Clostridia bacterium]|nr:DUF1015 domain-containing protein [Clostridia bacterium]